MSAADAVAHAVQLGRDEERTRAELTAQFRAMGKRVVHEAGNPLAIVKNYLQVLANKAGDSGQFREELTILNEELDRIARIVQRMGDPFVAEGDGAGPLDLNALVREVMTLCNDTLFAGRGIEVHQQLDPRLAAVALGAGRGQAGRAEPDDQRGRGDAAGRPTHADDRRQREPGRRAVRVAAGHATPERGWRRRCCSACSSPA